jgi:phytanoyl-CoA hydroxylase
MTIHRADGNQSRDRSRRALGFVYAARRAVEDLDKKKAYYETLNADLVSKGKL